MKIGVDLTVNGEAMHLDVEPGRTLLEVLRDDLGLRGARDGCGTGDCGACTVLLDGEPINSCLTLPVLLRGRSITTIEGLTGDTIGKALQDSLVEHGAVQCGYCSPGLVLAARALLAEYDAPDEPAIRRAISGNLCRCTGYAKIVEAISAAASSLRDERMIGGSV